MGYSPTSHPHSTHKTSTLVVHIFWLTLFTLLFMDHFQLSVHLSCSCFLHMYWYIIIPLYVTKKHFAWDFSCVLQLFVIISNMVVNQSFIGISITGKIIHKKKAVCLAQLVECQFSTAASQVQLPLSAWVVYIWLSSLTE